MRHRERRGAGASDAAPVHHAAIARRLPTGPSHAPDSGQTRADPRHQRPQRLAHPIAPEEQRERT